MRPDGPAWRRIVPSPERIRIVEQSSVQQLLDGGAVVIYGGGGGAPVTQDDHGRLAGVQAVVDRDYLSARLALDLHADRLRLLTDVSAVMRDFCPPEARPIDHIGIEHLAEVHLAIGALTDAAAVMHGEAGATIARLTSAAHAPPPGLTPQTPQAQGDRHDRHADPYP